MFTKIWTKVLISYHSWHLIRLSESIIIQFPLQIKDLPDIIPFHSLFLTMFQMSWSHKTLVRKKKKAIIFMKRQFSLYHFRFSRSHKNLIKDLYHFYVMKEAVSYNFHIPKSWGVSPSHGGPVLHNCLYEKLKVSSDVRWGRRGRTWFVSIMLLSHENPLSPTYSGSHVFTWIEWLCGRLRAEYIPWP